MKNSKKIIAFILVLSMVISGGFFNDMTARAAGDYIYITGMHFENGAGEVITEASFGDTVSVVVDLATSETDTVETVLGGSITAIAKDDPNQLDYYLGTKALVPTKEFDTAYEGGSLKQEITLSGEDFAVGDSFTIAAKLNADEADGANASSVLNITRKDIATEGYTIQPISDQNFFPGTPSTPTVEVSRVVNGVKEVLDAANYTVNYENNDAVGAATITVTGTGSYKGTISTNFNVVLNEKKIIVTPFDNQWKYYGQTRTFLKDEHYTLSKEDDFTAGNWTFGIESEEVGMQNFVVTGDISNGEERLVIADKAPKFEVRGYNSNTVVDVDSDWRNTTDPVEIEAPKGFLISGAKVDGQYSWGESITTGELNQGVNEVSYYLRSNKEDNTKNAIDQTEKKVILKADTIVPEIRSLSGDLDVTDETSQGGITGSEAGTYYYMIVPTAANLTITPELIKQNVLLNYGIVGYGRVDGVKASVFNFSGMTAKTEYRVYAFMEDQAGNASPMVYSNAFTTDPMALKGTITITGTVATGNILTATTALTSVGAENVKYQWYRMKYTEDAADFEAVLDETGGAAADDLEADDSDDEEDEDDDDGDEEDVEEESKQGIHTLATSIDASVESATLIPGAVSQTYIITNEDIGYRLICKVEADNYSGYISEATDTFVPKLATQVTLPTLASTVYSPSRTLAAYTLPAGFSWVDNTITPVYGNSGYRAKYVPEDTKIYRTMIVRIQVPIAKKSISSGMVKNLKNVAYTSKNVTKNFTMKDGNRVLPLNKDYKVTYKNNHKVGKATATIRGAGNYKGTLRIAFKITKKSIRKVTMNNADRKPYSGHAITPSVVVKNGSVRLTKNKDYTIRYSNNVNIGTGKIIIQGMGNYYGKKTISFKITPTKVKINKVTKGKTSMRLKFQSKYGAQKYEIQVSKSSQFSSKSTQTFVANGTTLGLNSLDKKGTYYVRIRGYAKVGSKVIYGSFCDTKRIKL